MIPFLQCLIHMLSRRLAKICVITQASSRIDHADEDDVVDWVNPEPGPERASTVVATFGRLIFCRAGVDEDHLECRLGTLRTRLCLSAKRRCASDQFGGSYNMGQRRKTGKQSKRLQHCIAVRHTCTTCCRRACSGTTTSRGTRSVRTRVTAHDTSLCGGWV